jgi:hypothetical protein
MSAPAFIDTVAVIMVVAVVIACSTVRIVCATDDGLKGCCAPGRREAANREKK